MTKKRNAQFFKTDTIQNINIYNNPPSQQDLRLETRNRRISYAVTPTEEAILKELMERYGHRDMSTFSREAIFNFYNLKPFMEKLRDLLDDIGP